MASEKTVSVEAKRGIRSIAAYPQTTDTKIDSHYCEGVSAVGQGYKDTPIYEELNHIFNAPGMGHVIIIDDPCCFETDPVYPSIQELNDFIKKRRTNMNIAIKDDSIRIMPQC